MNVQRPRVQPGALPIGWVDPVNGCRAKPGANAMSVVQEPELERLLGALHAKSDKQVTMGSFLARRTKESQPPAEAEIKQFRSEDPANGFRTMTLPFDGGLEMSVRCWRQWPAWINGGLSHAGATANRFASSRSGLMVTARF
jgi:hypothetical protein